MSQELPPAIERDDVVTVRRAPKIWRFAMMGAILGIIVALIGTFAFPNYSTEFTNEQIFGYLLIISVAVFGTLAAIVALVVDRRSLRRAKQVSVQRELLIVPDDDEDAVTSAAASADPAAAIDPAAATAAAASNTVNGAAATPTKDGDPADV